MRIVFYEPQIDPDISYGSINNELANPDGIEVYKLDVPIPQTAPPVVGLLADEAQFAFPTNSQEKHKARQRMGARKAAKKAARKRVEFGYGPPLPPSDRHAKSPAKRTMKKTGAKKSPTRAAIKSKSTKSARKSPAKRKSPTKRA